MLMFQTERLIAKSHMTLVEGLLQPGVVANQNIIDIFSNDFDKKVDTQMCDSFVFFDITQPIVPVCYIEYFKKRDRHELHWETFEEFRKCGYMTEALTAFIQWAKMNTKDKHLWALINQGNTPSIKTAHRCGFVVTDKNSEGTKWYKATLDCPAKQVLEETL